LYDKVEAKTRENDELKLRLKTCEKENITQQKDMKELIKKVKMLELQVQVEQDGRQSYDNEEK
jgi:flagellar basal body rod protein FlgF